jgi:hypothetical protein
MSNKTYIEQLRDKFQEIIDFGTFLSGDDAIEINKIARTALSLPEQEGGLKWVKVSERTPTGNVVDVYHVKVRYLDMDDSVLMPDTCTFSCEWETKDNIEVVEWLDESTPNREQEYREALDYWKERAEYAETFLAITGYSPSREKDKSLYAEWQALVVKEPEIIASISSPDKNKE